MSYHSRTNKALTGLAVLGLVASFSKLACTPASSQRPQPSVEDRVDACLQPLGVVFERSAKQDSFNGVTSSYIIVRDGEHFPRGITAPAVYPYEVSGAFYPLGHGFVELNQATLSLPNTVFASAVEMCRKEDVSPQIMQKVARFFLPSYG